MRPRSAVLLLSCILAAGCGVKPRFVLVDVGAHMGESYLAFQKCRLYPEHRWEIFAIEANPILAAKLPQVPRLTVISKAAWIAEGKMDFLMESDDSGANSLIKEHFRASVPERKITVDTFDFSEWVKQFSVDDYVIVSMDIEGAEYSIIRKMIKDGTFRHLDRFYAEMHFHTLETTRGFNRVEALRKSREILRNIGKRGLIVGDDSIEDIMKSGAWVDFLL